MLLVLGITLYTSRIVLKQLGIIDYGIYSIIGGIVAMFAFLSGAMATATQRYLSFDIGKGDANKTQKTFSAILTIYIGIALILLLFAETIGLWYVNNKMVFPEERSYAVNVVYQFSLLTTLLTIIQAPYDALILAKERMVVYAYVSILEVILKLVIVFLLTYFASDKLIIYAILVFIVSFMIRLIYQIYCRKKFAESKYHFEYDKLYFKELVSYLGWSMFGSTAVVGRTQGNNVMLNLFFGTVVNAAYGLTLQVQTAIRMFVRNFQLAVNPQIIKSYAKRDLIQTHKLIIQSSKLSFFLMLILILPLLYNTGFVLNLWLTQVPEFTAVFIQLMLIVGLIEDFSGPLKIGIQATGKIKWYQIITGSIVILNLPISYLMLKVLNFPPPIVFKVMIMMSLIALSFRVYFLKLLLGFSVLHFLKKVVWPILTVTVLIYSLLFLVLPLVEVDNSWMSFIIDSLIIITINISSILLLGLTKAEKYFIKTSLKKFTKL